MAAGGSSKGGLCNQEKQGWTVSVQLRESWDLAAGALFQPTRLHAATLPLSLLLLLLRAAEVVAALQPGCEEMERE